MPVQIMITGADATESLKELSVLAAAITGTEQLEKPRRQRKTDKLEVAKDTPQEPEVAKDAVNDSVEVAESKVWSSEELKETVKKICDTPEKNLP